MPIEEMEDFVLVKTPYCERKHLNRATLVKMESEKLIEVARPSGRIERGLTLRVLSSDSCSSHRPWQKPPPGDEDGLRG